LKLTGKDDKASHLYMIRFKRTSLDLERYGCILVSYTNKRRPAGKICIDRLSALGASLRKEGAFACYV